MPPAPRVTIALCVYNGAGTLREMFDDLLAQSFGDFALLVSDNGSTDETPAIAAEYARSDRRIRVIRHPGNVGSKRNFEAIVDEARTPFFMYAAHDDRFTADYLERMLDALAANPAAVMACADSILIDEYARRKGPIYRSLHTAGMPVTERIRAVISQFAWHEFYGVMRTPALRAAGGVPPYIGGDVIHLLKLSLLGEVITIREPLFLYRSPTSRVGNYAYYETVNLGTPQSRQMYNALVGHFYRTVLDAGLGSDVEQTIFKIFVDTIPARNPDLIRSILTERGLDASSVSLEQARSIVADILTGVEDERRTR